MINDFALRIGNYVKTATNGANATGVYPLYVDSDGKLAVQSATTGSLVHAHSTDGSTEALKVTQATSTLEFAEVNGIPSEGSLTSSLVYGATGSMTTKGFLRIRVVPTPGDAVGTTGFYYIPFGILA